MVNTQYLENCIKRSGLKKESIALEIGITRQALANKINNKNLFNGAEIKALIRILKLTCEEVMAIFFADDVHLEVDKGV